MGNDTLPAVNIEEIMVQIRREAKELKYTEPVSFEEVEIPASLELGGGKGSFDRQALQDEVNAVNASWNIPYGHAIEGGLFKRTLARLARRLFRPTGAPMAQAISAHNAEVTKTLNSMMQFIQDSEKKVQEQEKRIFELEAEVRRLKAAQGKKA